MSLKRLAIVCLLAAPLIAVGPATAEPKDDCNWGASSVIVEQVNGQYVQSEPVTTGCVPPR